MGALLLFAQMLAFNATNVAIKLASATTGAEEIVFIRFSIAAAILLIASLCFSGANWRSAISIVTTCCKWKHVHRAFVIYVATTLWAYALAILPLATATCLYFTKSFFVGALSPVVLGEKTTPRHWASMILGLLGVTLVAHPTDASISAAGCAVALMAAAAAALGAIQAKSISRSISPLEMSTAFTALMALVSAPPAILHWAPLTLQNLALISVAAVLLILSLISGVLAFRYVSMPNIAVVEFGRFVISVLADLLIFGHRFEISTVVGGSVVILAIGVSLSTIKTTAKTPPPSARACHGALNGDTERRKGLEEAQ